MDRWTMEQMSKLDSVDFAIAILNERRNKVTPYSPLGQKCLNSAHELSGMKEKMMDPEETYVVSLLKAFGGTPVACTKAAGYTDAVRIVAENTGHSENTLYAKTVKELMEVLNG